MSIKPFSEVGRLAAMATGASLIAMDASGVLGPISESGSVISGTNQGDSATLEQLISELSFTGARYDPSDLTSLYQSRTGGLNSTNGSVVGIMLDKSKMGGKTAAQYISSQPELWTNPAASFDLGGGGGSPSYNTSTRVLSNPTPSSVSGYPRTRLNLGLTVGKWYLVTGQIDGDRAGLGSPRLATSGATANLVYNTTTGVIYGLVRAESANLEFVTSVTSTYSITIASLSVKEISGSHAIAPSDAARPLLGSVPVGGRRNLCLYSQAFDNAAWTKSRATVVANATVAPDGTTTAYKLVEDNTAGATHRIYLSVDKVTASAITYTGTIYAKAAERSVVSFKLPGKTEADQSRIAVYLRTGEISAIGGSGFTSASASATSVGNGWWRVSLAATSDTDTKIVLFAQVSDTLASTGSYNGNGTSGIYIWGAQLDQAATATPYQKVITANEITEEGVRTVYFLVTDGSNDWMQVYPAPSLGTQWWHVGGWHVNADSDYFFALTDATSKTSIVSSGAPPISLRWRNAADTGFSTLVSGAFNTAHILTVERDAVISGRLNGATGSSFAPYDEPGTGLTLFAASLTLGGGPLAGRFYGGAFGTGVISNNNRSLMEEYYSNKTGATLA